MSFQYFKKEKYPPELFCNSTRHASEYEGGIHHMLVASKSIIYGQENYAFFCDDCIWYLKINDMGVYRFQANDIYFKDGTIDKELFDEYQKCAQIILSNHIVQVAFNQNLLKKYRLSKKLKKIFNALLKKHEIISGKDSLEKFAAYCHQRKSLSILIDNSKTEFYSQLIKEGKERFEELVSNNFFNIKQKEYIKLPLKNDKQVKIYFTYQQNHFLVCNLNRMKSSIEIYTEVGDLIKKIQFSIIYRNKKFMNVQTVFSKDKQYLILLINYIDIIIYEWDSGNSINNELESQSEENQLFQTNGQIFIVTYQRIWKFNSIQQSFEICQDFQNLLLGKYQFGYFCQQKNINILFYEKMKETFQPSQILAITNSQCTCPLNIIQFRNLKSNEKILQKSILVSEMNNLIYYISQIENKLILNQYSIVFRKKVREMVIEGIPQNIDIQLYLFSELSKLALVYGQFLRVYNLKTFRYILTVVQNDNNPKFDQQFQLIDQKYLFKAGIDNITIQNLIST